jgi:hypothetical protein
LPEQGHGRIPRRICPVAHPAPIRGNRQQHPRAFAERSSQVSRHGVNGNNQIQSAHELSRIRYIVSVNLQIVSVYTAVRIFL